MRIIRNRINTSIIRRKLSMDGFRFNMSEFIEIETIIRKNNDLSNGYDLNDKNYQYFS